jgi:Crinkler effector protein N-terminal domain
VSAYLSTQLSQCLWMIETSALRVKFFLSNSDKCHSGSFEPSPFHLSLRDITVAMVNQRKPRSSRVSTPVPAQTSTQPRATTSSIASARNPAAAIADDTIHTLWCLVEGDSTPFKITAPPNIDIVDLKKLIREEGINVSEHAILAKDLVLLKVSPF